MEALFCCPEIYGNKKENPVQAFYYGNIKKKSSYNYIPTKLQKKSFLRDVQNFENNIVFIVDETILVSDGILKEPAIDIS